MLMENHIVVYREFDVRGMIAQDQALNIKSLSIGERIGGIYASPDMWGKRGVGYGQSAADEYEAVGVNLTRANNDRLAGVGRIHRALDHRMDMPPELWILDNCSDLIRVLPDLPSDPIRPEDVLKMDGDDPYESLRYGLMAADARSPQVLGNQTGRWKLTTRKAPPQLTAPR